MTDMSRTLLIVPVVTGLLGCQTPAAVQVSPATAAAGPACYVDNEALPFLLREQTQYLLAPDAAARTLLLAHAVNSNEKAREALLLTSPAASAEQFGKGTTLLASLPLYPDGDCIADRYMQLHYRQSQRRQQQQLKINELNAQVNELNTQVVELKSKIEALTDLEQEITRQRKDL